MTSSVNEKQKSKKASDVRSLRHEDKPAQSISSLSSHIEQLEETWNRLIKQQKTAVKAIIHFEQIRNQFIGRTDQFSKEEADEAEGEIQMWKEKLR